MTLFEEAKAKQLAKRSDRLKALSKKANATEFATYQGKSTIDGTDIVQVGANEPTSGYRVISNAPLNVGEKVSLRLSANGGLQRVDARNRPIATPEADQPTTEELVIGNLALIEIITPAGSDNLDLISSGNIKSGGLLEYKYRARDKRFLRKGVFNIASNTIPPTVGATTVINFQDEGETQNNFVTFTPATPPSPLGSLFAIFEVYFDAVVWGDIFTPWLGSYSGSAFNTAPVEVEISLNGITNFPSLTIGFASPANLYFITADVQASPATPVITFSFRWRKRGTDRWFSLKRVKS